MRNYEKQLETWTHNRSIRKQSVAKRKNAASIMEHHTDCSVRVEATAVRTLQYELQILSRNCCGADCPK